MQPSKDPEVVAETLAALPESFLPNVLQSIFNAYETAPDQIREMLDAPEASNAEGGFRGLKVQGNLRGVAQRFPDELTTAAVPSVNGWFHTEVRCGSIVLTASSVRSPCGPVSSSTFREALAAETVVNPQNEFFPVDDGSLIYVMVLHSRYLSAEYKERLKYSRLPGAVWLAWPKRRDLAAYVHRVNLYQRHPDVLDTLLPKDWDHDARLRYKERASRIWI